MIRIENLSYGYGTETALQLPDWQAAKGEQWLILGPSGSGKSPLLHLLAGLLLPRQGRIHIAGQTLDELSEARRDTFRARHIGIVFQRPHLLAQLSVCDNLLLAQYLAELPQNRQRIEALLERLGLAGLAARRPHQLSQGQLQRVTLARALLNQPDVLLADEPTANLDDQHCEQVLTLLQQQAQECQATLVIATHDQRVKSRFEHRLSLGGGA